MRRALFLAVALGAAGAALALPAAAPATQVLVKPAPVAAAHGLQDDADICGATAVWADDRGGVWQVYEAADGGGGAFGVAAAVRPAAAAQTHPSIGQHLIVWQQKNPGTGWDIEGWSLDGAAPVPICEATGDQIHPRLDTTGAECVWQDKRGGTWDVWGASISLPAGPAAPPAPLATGPGDQLAPDVADGRVVYQDMATGGGDIKAVDFVSPGTPTTVCGNGKRQDEPRVDGDTVVWRDWRAVAGDGTDIWGSSVAAPSPYPVCQAVADQQSPAISGDVVVFADYRDQFLMGSPTRGPDIRFCDLTLSEDGFVCLNSGAQDRPAIDGDRVVWSDWRAGATRPDVWRAVLTPWTAAVWFDGVGRWTDTPIVTLDLYADSKAGAVVEMLVYNRGQSPPPGTVAYGETLSGWDLTTGVSPADGPRTVCAQFLDGGAVSSPVVVAKTTLDTTAPVPQAPSKATVVRGSKATLKYRVYDNLAPRTTVTIRIRNAGGTTVKTLSLGKVATGKKLSTSFTCSLAKGTYHFVVSARDLAGNGGVPASNTLTVR